MAQNIYTKYKADQKTFDEWLLGSAHRHHYLRDYWDATWSWQSRHPGNWECSKGYKKALERVINGRAAAAQYYETDPDDGHQFCLMLFKWMLSKFSNKFSKESPGFEEKLRGKFGEPKPWLAEAKAGAANLVHTTTPPDCTHTEGSNQTTETEVDDSGDDDAVGTSTPSDQPTAAPVIDEGRIEDEASLALFVDALHNYFERLELAVADLWDGKMGVCSFNIYAGCLVTYIFNTVNEAELFEERWVAEDTHLLKRGDLANHPLLLKLNAVQGLISTNDDDFFDLTDSVHIFAELPLPPIIKYFRKAVIDYAETKGQHSLFKTALYGILILEVPRGRQAVKSLQEPRRNALRSALLDMLHKAVIKLERHRDALKACAGLEGSEGFRFREIDELQKDIAEWHRKVATCGFPTDWHMCHVICDVLCALHLSSPHLVKITTFHALFHAYLARDQRLPKSGVLEEIMATYPQLIFPNGRPADGTSLAQMFRKFVDRVGPQRDILDRRIKQVMDKPLLPVAILSSKFGRVPKDLDEVKRELEHPKHRVSEWLDVHSEIFSTAKRMDVHGVKDVMSRLESNEAPSLLEAILQSISSKATSLRMTQPWIISIHNGFDEQLSDIKGFGEGICSTARTKHGTDVFAFHLRDNPAKSCAYFDTHAASSNDL